MKLITYLSDQDFNQTLPTPNRIGYKVRIAGRAILTNGKNEVVLMWVSKYSIYKLPGGGIEDHEDIHEGLKREVLEETGFSCIVGDEIGITIEFRDEWKMVQISHCFKANISSKESGKNFTEEEISDGFELRWVPISEAVGLMESHLSSEYDSQFMQKRDLAILKTVVL